MKGTLRFHWSLLLTLACLVPMSSQACALRNFEVLLADGFERCQRDQSSFQALGHDMQIEGIASQIVLSHVLELSAPTSILAVADGRYFPVDAPAASVRIRINGDDSHSSVPITDWGSSQRPVMHAFNVLASTQLAPGTHLIELIASAHPSRPGRFRIGAGSGLSVLVQPHSQLSVSALVGESETINLTTYDPDQGIDVTEGDLDRPYVSLLEHSVRNRSGRPTWAVSLASGRGFNACNGGIDNGYGDALLGLYGNNICQGTENAAWSVNDIHPDAELQAAMMLHSAHALQPGESLLTSLIGSELAFGSDQATAPSGAHENGVCWGLGSARLITATGGAVSGRAPSGPNQLCATYTWRCVATTQASPTCPPAGTDVILTSAQLGIPFGHDGIVLFNARSRIQADNSDGFATATLGLKVNGIDRGAIGVQQLADGAGEASRTLSASLLTAPDAPGGALAPGLHTIEVYMRVEGNRLRFPSAPSDLSLTWFD